MKLSLILILGLFLGLPSLSFGVSTALSPTGYEAVLSFQSRVVLPQGSQPTEPIIGRSIKAQTNHLLGLFEAWNFSKLANESLGGGGLNPATDALGLMGLGPIIDYRVQSVVETPQGFEVQYTVRQKIIIKKRLAQPQSRGQFSVLLPRFPHLIYAKTCTHPDYPEREYFFYFWNPYKSICKPYLVGPNEIISVEAQFYTYVPPAIDAKPNYNRLRAQIERQGELRVALLLGFDQNSRSPRDSGRKSYFETIAYYQKKGFVAEKQADFSTKPYVVLKRPGSAYRPPVSLFISLSDSDVETPRVFAQRARFAFETADIVMYAGHSGVGGNLDLERLGRLSSPDPTNPIPIRFPRKYQIFFFDSCASYFFYAHDYVRAKGGAQYVDVITNGLASYYYSQNGDIRAFFKDFLFADTFLDPKGAPSWLEILSSIDRVAGPTYLINVMPITIQ
ncbi:MAG: hypothetical protein IT289_09590 [Oligoflexia bacterium]|nr:hypothetical protein [Oligoflexia bacterium]